MEMEIVCVSGGAGAMEVFFKVPEGVQCEGIQVVHSGNESVLTFIAGGNPARLQVSSKAVLSEEGSFAGSLLVEVPIPLELQTSGNEFIVRVSGDSSNWFTWKAVDGEG